MHDQMPSGDRITTHQTQRESDYWSDFYERQGFDKGSSFCESINALPDFPATIIDIGCGQGRDSFAFARAGKQVIGLDRSDVGVARAQEKATNEGVDNNLSFAVCDVSDEANVAEIITGVREQTEGPVCFYMRFFLHSIPEDTQEKLMTTLSNFAETGDVFTAEFRTDKDEDGLHEFGDTHYRRYQNADDFSKKLQEDYGWSTVSEVEDQGLSPYKDEDPTLYRVIAVKS